MGKKPRRCDRDQGAKRPPIEDAIRERQKMLSSSFESLDDPFAEALSKVIASSIRGGELVLSGALDETSRPELLADAPNAAKRLAERSQKLMADIRSQVESVHPMALVVRMMWGNVVTSNDYFEPTFLGSEARFETLVGVLLTHSSLDAKVTHLPDPGRVQAVFDLLEELELVMRLRALAANLDQEGSKAGLRVLSQLRWLTLRGDSYPQHAVSLATEVLGPLDAEMRKALGFTVSDLILLCETAQSLVERRINELAAYSHRKAEHFVGQVERGDVSDAPIVNVYRREGKAGVFQREFLARFEFSMLEAMTFTAEELVQENEDLVDCSDAILQTLSKELGSLPKESFQSPYDFNPLNLAPFIAWSGRIALPVPGLIMRDYLGVLEPTLMEEVSTYSRHRGEALERIALELIGEALPGSDRFSNLYYHVEENGEKKRVELDGLVLYDRYAVAIEAKSTPLSVQASRGDVDRLKSDLRRSAEKAGEQLARALKAMRTSDSITFETKSGTPQVTVGSADLVRVFPVAPSLHELGGTGVVSVMLQDLGLFEDFDVPWSVFVNNLRVIVETCAESAEFLHYMIWRSRLPLGDRTMAIDELDVFGAFLFAEDILDRLDREPDLLMNLGSYTTDFDDFYLWREELGSPRPSRPKKFTADVLRNYVKAESSTRAPGWLDRCGAVLDMTLDEIAAFEARRKPIMKKIEPTEVRVEEFGSMALVGLGHELDPDTVVDDIFSMTTSVRRILYLQRIGGKIRIVNAVSV